MASHGSPVALPPERDTYHLASATLSFNTIRYAIIGRITFDFRKDDGSALTSVRLDPLIADESQAGPGGIDVIFHGRWQRACAFLKKLDVICVSCARVVRAADLEVHSVQLEFLDPIAVSDREPSLYLLTPSLTACVNVVRYSQLDSAQVPNLSSLIPPAGAGVTPKRGRGRAHNTKAGARKSYVYKSIESLWNEVSDPTAPRPGPFNVYGVVVDCRAPCVTSGTDLRSEIIIVDESSTRGTSAVTELKTLCIYRFERKAKDAIPFRAAGDIIRAHRLQLGVYNDTQSGRRHVQGRAQFHSTFVLWGHEDDSFEPLAIANPVRQASSPNAPDSSAHTLTEDDRKRVAALREWGRTFLSSNTSFIRPYLRSIQEVVQAPPSADFLTKSFDLICVYDGEHGVPPAQPGGVRFRVVDGVNSSFSLIVESEISEGHKMKAPEQAFVDFSLSLRLRPRTTPTWLLIRDVRIRNAGHPGSYSPIATLSISKKSSTLVWQSPHAPEVRRLIEMRARISSGGAVHSTNGINSASGADSANCIEPSAMNLHRELSAEQQQAEAARTTALEDRLADRWPSITSHKHTDMTIIKIPEVKERARRGVREACRVIARVRGVRQPRDVRFACRPYCRQCGEFLKASSADNVFRCAECNTSYGADHGSVTQWAYFVRLVLEDESGARIDSWVEGNAGDTFFGALKATDLVQDDDACKKVANVLGKLSESSSRIDCILQPFYSEDEFGWRHVACRIIDTHLLPAILPT